MASSSDALMPFADREKLRTKFQHLPAAQHTTGWDELWQASVTPWDRKGPSLALHDAVTGREPSPPALPVPQTSGGRRKRALVPGCGRGYDVLLLAALGYDAYGLDASRTALAAAAELARSAATQSAYAAFTPAGSTPGKAEFVEGDFFADEFLAETGGGGGFDLVFDYTFLCALPVELRARWAARMSGLVEREEGRLVCLEWPLGRAPGEGGPPHGLTSSLYEQLFLHPGEEVQYDDRGIVTEDADRKRGEGALERVAHYMPERTHEQGRGKDYVSIWRHWKG